MCPAYYEINVSLNGRHFFATHKRSMDTERKFKEVLEVFRAKFPENEGYRITATAQVEYGNFVFDSKGEYTK